MTNNMKILFCTPFQVPGGITRYAQHVISYYKNVSPKGIHIDIMPMDRGIVRDDISMLARLYKGAIDYWEICTREKNILHENKYDIIHIASSASISLFKDILMIWNAHKAGAKAITHFHFGRIPQLCKANNWEWKLLKTVVKLSDAVIVLDKTSYRVLCEEGCKNIYIVPNPIAPKVLDIIKRNQIDSKTPRSILFVGQHLKTKGIHDLVAACKDIPNISVKMVGSVTHTVKQQLQKEADQGYWLEITGEMPFEDVIKETLKCEIYCLPTYTEGFPNAILESMACGCAIVTTPVGAIPSMLEKEGGKEYGIMVEPRNVDQLKKAIETLLDDPERRKAFGENAQKRVNERYNINTIWKELTNVWTSLT